MATNLLKIASSPAVTAPDSAPIDQVARVMAEKSVGLVVLVDGGRQMTGVVTDRDLVTRAITRGLPHHTPVSEVMSREVASVTQHASTLDAARQMALHNTRRLPVIDDRGAVVGVLSVDDIYRAEGEVLEQIKRLIDPRRGDRTRPRA